MQFNEEQLHRLHGKRFIVPRTLPAPSSGTCRPAADLHHDHPASPRNRPVACRGRRCGRRHLACARGVDRQVLGPRRRVGPRASALPRGGAVGQRQNAAKSGRSPALQNGTRKPTFVTPGRAKNLEERYPQMSVPESIPELTALFERLGARDPESWARSQIRERIPQLHRYLFLRQCWQHVIGEDSTGWVDYHIEQAEQDPRGSFAGMGAALKRAVAAGPA